VKSFLFPQAYMGCELQQVNDKKQALNDVFEIKSVEKMSVIN